MVVRMGMMTVDGHRSSSLVSSRKNDHCRFQSSFSTRSVSMGRRKTLEKRFCSGQKCSVFYLNRKGRSWCCTWKPYGGVQANAAPNVEIRQQKRKQRGNLLTLLLSVSSVPYSSYVPEPSSYLHRISAEVKQIWIVGALAVMAKASPEMRFCVAILIALISMSALPSRLWRPQLLRIGGLCAFIFLMTAFGSDGMAPILNNRSLPEGAFGGTNVADFPTSMPQLGQQAYKYVVLKLGPFTVTKRSLGLASAITGLTFVAIQGASLALVTTPSERMALAIGNLLRPLAWIGVPVRELVLTVLLSLRFMATVFEEARNLCLGIASRGIDWSLVGKRGAISLALKTCGRLFSNLLSKSEKIAFAMVARGFRGPTEDALKAIEATAGGKRPSLTMDIAALIVLIGVFVLSRILV